MVYEYRPWRSVVALKRVREKLIVQNMVCGPLLEAFEARQTKTGPYKRVKNH